MLENQLLGKVIWKNLITSLAKVFWKLKEI